MIRNTFLFRSIKISIHLFLAFQLCSCDTLTTAEAKKEPAKEEEPIELAELMFHNQRYMDKLYYAGIHQNWKLAEFYRHEMEENMDLLIEEKVMEGDINVSDLAKTMFLPASEELKQTIQSKDTAVFLKGYDLALNSCNNCHAASGYDFIRIIRPSQPAFKNQEY